MILPVIFFSAASFANAEDNSLDAEDSMYKYNALENRNSFFNTTNNIDNPEEELLENNNLVNNSTIKLQDIIERQNSSIEKTEDAMNAIEDRSNLKAFVLGTRLGVLKYQMVQMKDQSYALNVLVLKTEDDTVKAQINGYIDTLEKQQTKVENFIFQQKDEFSLFGWLVSMR